MNLWQHQQQILDDFPHKRALVWDTGTGKTRASIALSNKADEETLVICPKALKENWRRQLKELSTVEWRVIHKEEFRRDWKKLKDYQCLIVDEAHYFFGTTSKMKKSLYYYLRRHDTEYRWLLTATPYRSTPMDVYVMSGHLGKPMEYDKFRQMFFVKNYFGHWDIREDIEDDIAGIVNEIASVVKKEDVSEIPDHFFGVEHFEQTKAQKKAVKDIDVPEHIVEFTKKHQISGGVLLGDEGYTEDKVIGSNKVKRVKELADEKDKLLVSCRYNFELEMLQEEIKEDNVYMMNGNTENRQELLDEVRSKDEYVLLVNAALSEGWQLPECDTLVFYSLDFQLKNYIQMRGRIDRMDHITKNYYLHLVTTDTIDEAVYESMKNKEDFLIKIYAQNNS